MAETRKLEKFDLESESGTQKMLKFVEPSFAAAHDELAIRTPRAEISPLLMQEARQSSTPCEPAQSVDKDTPPSNAARSVDREPVVENLRTRLARKFTTLADEVTEGFDDFRIGGGAWGVELTAPEGMSTGGGKRAMQHLRLKPRRQGHAVLVGGVVNGVAGDAELRDYDHMKLLYGARFGRDLEITAGEWEQFLRKAEVVLHKATIQTRRVTAPRDVLVAARQANAGDRNRKLAMIALGVIAPLALLVAWRVIVALMQ